MAELPEIFDPDQPKILAVGIHKAISERFSLPYHTTQAVLRRWTRRIVYLCRVAEGGTRHGLDGSIAGEIDAAARAHALKALARQLPAPPQAGEGGVASLA